MADIVPFTGSGRSQSESCQGSLEVWQAADGTWTIDHVSRSGDSAGVVQAGIPSQQEAMATARGLAVRYNYWCDGLAYTGSRP